MNLDAKKKNQNQSTWRLWGEEKTDNALYTIYLKKVRYHQPLKSVSLDSDDNISHLEWETVRVKFVKAGTLEKLVECLTGDDYELESTYINVFFATYRTFTSPHKLLALMLERYEKLINNEFNLPDTVVQQCKKSIVVSIHVWLDSYPDDFRDPPLHAVLQKLISFAQHYIPESDLLLKAKHKLQRLLNEDVQTNSNTLLSPPESGISFSTNGCHSISCSFPNVSCKHVAEQLTRIDMELFKKVIPHQCLGAVWSRRDKSRSTEAASVLATVSQFNAVSFRVMSTVLMDPNLKNIDRAKIIATWIDIAQELRVLKNFSSLKAIVSGLQSSPVYRLHKTWQLVPKEKVEMFSELERIFSEDNNQWAQRELLIKEGTAKFADTVGQNDKHLQKIIQRQLNNSGSISHGTVPYLGTFLTDLTMIDTAIPDYIHNRLINFDKRRKEFEILAQIKLLQGAANAYNLVKDAAFDRWFDSILILDEHEAYRLSCSIESENLRGHHLSSGTFSAGMDHGVTSGTGAETGAIIKQTKYEHKKSDSLASSSGDSSSHFYFDLSTDSLQSSPRTSFERKKSFSQISTSSSTSSTVSTSDNSHTISTGLTADRIIKTPSTNSSATHNSMSCLPLTEFYIIRVTTETDSSEAEGIVLYKSIMLSNNERTPQVIRNAMIKLGIHGNPDNYTLSQIFPDKELELPPNANVFYAVNTAYDLNFILRKKEKLVTKQTCNNNFPNKCKTNSKNSIPLKES
ncbi:ral guanine nucleotide dissociation stimulator-like 1 isoform X2 [Planococcus citri]|uniref:ral guanine nucleotide dissociation stimulator-like 1 isoform X2 n=1 Tax=Planococcus citri TaxID=170843 RepID=UPI0031F879DD